MTEPQDRRVSFYTRAQGSGFEDYRLKREAYQETGVVLTLYEALRRSRTNRKLIAAIEELRTLEVRSPEWYEFKATRLPAITPSLWYGSSGQRRQADGGARPTGAVPLDYDHVGWEAVDELRAIAADVAGADGYPHTIAAFRSPSGDGLKVIVHVSPVPRDADEHERAYWRAADVYNAALGAEAALDERARSIAQLCFLSADPDMVLRAARETRALRWER